MNSVVGTTMRLVPPQATNDLAERLGASSSAVQVGIGLCVAALLTRIANLSVDPLFMTRLFGQLREPETTSGTPNLPDLPAVLFGLQRAAVEDLVGSRSGLGTIAGGALMSIAAEFTVKALGQEIDGQGLTVSSFRNFAALEARKVKSILPGSLRRLLSGPSVPTATELGKANAHGC